MRDAKVTTMSDHDGGLARVCGFFILMLGIGLILDADALRTGASVMLAAGALFAWGSWQGRRALGGPARRQRSGGLQ